MSGLNATESGKDAAFGEGCEEILLTLNFAGQPQRFDGARAYLKGLLNNLNMVAGGEVDHQLLVLQVQVYELIEGP